MKNDDVSDYWLHFASEFGRRTPHIAPRFFDLKPDRWEELCAIYYARHGFKSAPADDQYIGKIGEKEVIRSQRVDAIVLENPALSEGGMDRFYHDSWMFKKKRLAKQRSDEPDVIILPPPPQPPKPKPVELPKEEPKPEKPPRSETRIKLGVWLTVLTPVVMAASFFVPAPWNLVAKAIFEALKLLVGG